MPVRTCEVGFKDHRGIRHSAEVQAETLYEAVVLAVRILRDDPWLEAIGPESVLDVDARPPSTRHAISLAQVERWLGGATTSPNEASKKAKLRMMLVKA